jgi:hypothetical protein
LSRRFPYVYDLKGYAINELCDILIRFIETHSDVKVKDVKCMPALSNLLFSMLVRLSEEIPDVFKNQAGDMLNIGTFIVKAINCSTVKFRGKNVIQVVTLGINEFLRSKGCVINM